MISYLKVGLLDRYTGFLIVIDVLFLIFFKKTQWEEMTRSRQGPSLERLIGGGGGGGEWGGGGGGGGTGCGYIP